ILPAFLFPKKINTASFCSKNVLQQNRYVSFFTKFFSCNDVLIFFILPVSTAVSYDRSIRAIRVKVPDSDEEFLLHPATVRRNDRSAQSVDEWTGEQKVQYGDIPEDIEPEEIRPMGNYAVSITWPDGFSQIAPYDQLEMLERLVDVPRATTAAVSS
ncbi:Os01g0719700, partial [Oryza sativa Japonica Group]